MKNTSRGINLHGGIEKIDPNISIPDTWAENSNRNIQDSQGELVRTENASHVDNTSALQVPRPVLND